MGFLRHNSGVRGSGRPRGHQRGARGRALGAPSARVFLGRLRPRRADRRFPEQQEDSGKGLGEQGQQTPAPCPRTPELCLENPSSPNRNDVDISVTHVSEHLLPMSPVYTTTRGRGLG